VTPWLQRRDRFLEKEVWEASSGGSKISKWGGRRAVGAELMAEFERRRREDRGAEGAKGVRCGERVSPSPEKMSILDLK